MKNMFKQFSILPIFEDEKVYGSKIHLNSIKLVYLFALGCILHYSCEYNVPLISEKKD